MSINLFYISNEIEIAKVIDESSIDYIFIDLEFIGKEKRQKKRDTVISKHCVSDISKIKKVISSTKILCRVNPIGAWSYREINEVIDQGADLIMLPFFKSIKEVETFLRIVDQRIECSLLFETIESISKIWVKYYVLKLKITKFTKKYAISNRFWVLGWSQDADPRSLRV